MSAIAAATVAPAWPGTADIAAGAASAPAASNGGDPDVQALQQVEDAVRFAREPLDAGALAAIMGSVQGDAPGGGGQPEALEKVMTMIGGTLAQGQGAYYIAINAPGASLMTSMTPGQLGAYMQSGGTLYKDTLVAGDHRTYSIYGLLTQAQQASQRAEILQASTLAAVDPRLQVAENVLDQMRADEAPAGSQRAVLFGSQSRGTETAKHIQAIVLQMPQSGAAGVQLTIVYIPPEPTSQAGAAGTATASAPPPETLQLTN